MPKALLAREPVGASAEMSAAVVGLAKNGSQGGATAASAGSVVAMLATTTAAVVKAILTSLICPLRRRSAARTRPAALALPFVRRQS
jgi:hypothetical protein